MDLRETQAIIERVRRLAAGLQQLDLSVEPALAGLQPGQAVLARVSSGSVWDPYLRDTWLPVSVEVGRLVVELPVGRVYLPGQVTNLLAPVGQPIALRDGAHRLLLIITDAAPTPLMLLARRAVAGGLAVTAVLSGRAVEYPLELFPPEVEILRGDTDWKWPDQVEMLGWADQVIALAPLYRQAEVYGGLYQAISQVRLQAVPDGYVFGLFYYRLVCGTGACQACQVTCRGTDRLACTDGPALDLKDVIFK